MQNRYGHRHPNLSHAATGDGLTVWQEYRGYWVGGGAGFIGERHVRPSCTRKVLFVQVMAEDDYLSGIGTGDAVNQNINWGAFDINAIMQDVAKFYADPTRGLGIDLYWTVTKFTMPTESHTYKDGSFVLNLYKHTGTNYYSGGHIITNGSMWVRKDFKLEREDGETYAAICEDGDNPTTNFGPMSKFIQHNRNDAELRDFLKIILPSRIGSRAPNGQYIINSSGHAQAYLDTSPAIFQGAHVNIVNIAEEKYVNTGTHYPSSEFIQRIGYCIAHEIFHLIGGLDLVSPNGISGLFLPLGDITASPAELLQINLPQRKSINR